MSAARTHNERIMDEYARRDRDVPISDLWVETECRICFRDSSALVREHEIQILSPNGFIHHGDNGRTDCGHDATGRGWWHRL